MKVDNICNLAEKACVSRQYLNKLFNGKIKNPGIETLIKIANVIGCTVDELRLKIKNKEIR